MDGFKLDVYSTIRKFIPWRWRRRRRAYIKIIVIMAIFLFGWYLSTEPLYLPTALLVSPTKIHLPKYIAHKSLVSDRHPGNSLEAIEEALNSPVESIEVDVRISKDGQLFLYHGDDLAEYTDTTGASEELTWSQLQQVTYHNSKSHLASLEELFQKIGSSKSIFIDAKTNKFGHHEYIEELKRLIYKYDLEESVIVESFNPLFLISMRLNARDLLVMYDFTTNSTASGEEVQAQFDQIPWLLKQPFIQKQIRRIVRPDFLGPRFNVDQELLKKLIDNGYPIISWTVDRPEQAKELFALGVTGLESNQPLRLMSAQENQSPNVYDAGGSTAKPYKIVNVRKLDDVIDSVQEAHKTKRKISIAGRLHTMGGQGLLADAIHLNMLGLNKIHYNQSTKSVTVQAGATWKHVQRKLAAEGRSIKVMQSDNIFSVGGSLGVNVHGWQVGSEPIAATVLAMKVVTADGKLLEVSKTKHVDLYKAILGGYGLLGVVVEAELTTVPNSCLKAQNMFCDVEDFAKLFAQHVSNNPDAELAYGRLSVNKHNLFTEAGIFWLENTGDDPSTEIEDESKVAFKRGVFRMSQYYDFGKKLRWSLEKMFSKYIAQDTIQSRNSVMNPDSHLLWPLYGENKDILQEYFVPKEQLAQFIAAFRCLVVQEEMNVLNVTIREVKKDTTSLLPYAKQDMFGLVILYSQPPGDEAEEHMKHFTKLLIDQVHKVDGTFYLPYRLHYTKEQLLESYPNLYEWLRIKKKWDRNGRFDSKFYQHITS